MTFTTIISSRAIVPTLSSSLAMKLSSVAGGVPSPTPRSGSLSLAALASSAPVEGHNEYTEDEASVCGNVLGALADFVASHSVPLPVFPTGTTINDDEEGTAQDECSFSIGPFCLAPDTHPEASFLGGEIPQAYPPSNWVEELDSLSQGYVSLGRNIHEWRHRFRTGRWPEEPSLHEAADAVVETVKGSAPSKSTESKTATPEPIEKATIKPATLTALSALDGDEGVTILFELAFAQATPVDVQTPAVGESSLPLADISMGSALLDDDVSFLFDLAFAGKSEDVQPLKAPKAIKTGPVEGDVSLSLGNISRESALLEDDVTFLFDLAFVGQSEDIKPMKAAPKAIKAVQKTATSVGTVKKAPKAAGAVKKAIKTAETAKKTIGSIKKATKTVGTVGTVQKPLRTVGSVKKTAEGGKATTPPQVVKKAGTPKAMPLQKPVQTVRAVQAAKPLQAIRPVHAFTPVRKPLQASKPVQKPVQAQVLKKPVQVTMAKTSQTSGPIKAVKASKKAAGTVAPKAPTKMGAKTTEKTYTEVARIPVDFKITKTKEGSHTTKEVRISESTTIWESSTTVKSRKMIVEYITVETFKVAEDINLGDISVEDSNLLDEDATMLFELAFCNDDTPTTAGAAPVTK